MTYSAPRRRLHPIVVEGVVLVNTLSANITSDRNGEIKGTIGVCWGVAEDGDEGASSGLADTHVKRSPITHVGSRGSPLAGIGDGGTSWVDVVLSRGGFAFPLIVVRGKWAGDFIGLAWLGVQWDGLRLGTWVIGTADGDVLGQLVGDLDTSSTSGANLLLACAGELEHSIGVTVKTSNGLSSGSLGCWPLGLLVTFWAGV